MKRLDLIGLLRDRHKILKELSYLCNLETENIIRNIDTEKLSGIFTDSFENEADAISDKLLRVKNAIDAVSPFAEKKSMLAPKAVMTVTELKNAEENTKHATEMTQNITELLNLKDKLKAEENKLHSLKQSLLPWVNFALPLTICKTKYTVPFIGTFPSGENFEGIVKAVGEVSKLAHIELISADGELKYAFGVVHGSAENEVFEVLRQFTFSRLYFKDINCTAKEKTAEIESRLGELFKETEKISSDLKKFSVNLRELEIYYDVLLSLKERETAREHLIVSEKTFALSGFIPEETVNKTVDILSKFDCAVEVSELNEEDDAPVLLKNSKRAEPYEMVTELYSLPAYGTVDPNPVMSIFFFFFFGIMFADIGYGLLLIALGYIIVKKKKSVGTVKKLFTIMMQCGISAILFGALFGSFFGNMIPTVTKIFTGTEYNIPILIDPIKQPLTIMIIAIAFGAVQILTGIAMKSYATIKEGKVIGGIIDLIMWYVLLIGLGLLFFKPELGKYLAYAGVFGLILTQGREEKSIVKKFTSGVFSLYNLVGIATDLLSYLRIFALCLSGGVLALVINILGGMSGGIKGIILFIFVSLIGHSINFGLSALSAFIHTSRLQFIEFYSKFFEDGGRPFKPLTISTNYSNIISEKKEI